MPKLRKRGSSNDKESRESSEPEIRMTRKSSRRKKNRDTSQESSERKDTSSTSMQPPRKKSKRKTKPSKETLNSSTDENQGLVKQKRKGSRKRRNKQRLSVNGEDSEIEINSSSEPQEEKCMLYLRKSKEIDSTNNTENVSKRNSSGSNENFDQNSLLKLIEEHEPDTEIYPVYKCTHDPKIVSSQCSEDTDENQESILTKFSNQDDDGSSDVNQYPVIKCVYDSEIVAKQKSQDSDSDSENLLTKLKKQDSDDESHTTLQANQNKSNKRSIARNSKGLNENVYSERELHDFLGLEGIHKLSESNSSNEECDDTDTTGEIEAVVLNSSGSSWNVSKNSSQISSTKPTANSSTQVTDESTICNDNTKCSTLFSTTENTLIAEQTTLIICTDEKQEKSQNISHTKLVNNKELFTSLQKCTNPREPLLNLSPIIKQEQSDVFDYSGNNETTMHDTTGPNNTFTTSPREDHTRSLENTINDISVLKQVSFNNQTPIHHSQTNLFGESKANLLKELNKQLLNPTTCSTPNGAEKKRRTVRFSDAPVALKTIEKPKFPRTPTRTKMPNFSLIHQRAQEKLESITEFSIRKAQRAHLLLSGQKPKQIPLKLSPQNKAKQKIMRKIEPIIKKTPLSVKRKETRVLNSKAPLVKPKFGDENLKAGMTRFGFKVQVKPINLEDAKKIIKKTHEPKTDVTQRRDYIKGVRSNKRFELLMKMRGK